MSGKRTIIVGICFLSMIAMLALFSGIFGYWHSDRSELIGFVDQDGNFLDLDGNPLPSFVGEDGTWVDLDGTPISDEEIRTRIREGTAHPILHEEWIMANPPLLDITADEVQNLLHSLELSNDFELWRNWGVTGNEQVELVEITIDAVNPLSDLQLMVEFEQFVTLILEQLGVDYPKDDIEQMMRTVWETEAVVNQIEYSPTIILVFSTYDEKSHFVIIAQHDW